MSHIKADPDDQIQTTFDHRLLWRLIIFTYPYRNKVLLAILLIIVASGLELLWPQFVRLAIDDFVLVAEMPVSEQKAGILRLAGFFLLTLMFSVVLEYARIVLMNKIGQEVLHDIRMKLYRHVEGLAMSFFSRQPVGRLVTRLTNDVSQLSELFTTGLVGIYADVIILLGILCFMLWMHVKMALLSLVVIPMIFYAALMFRRLVRPVYLDIRRNIARVNAFIQEHVSGIRVVQAFNRQHQTMQRFDDNNIAHLDSMKRMIQMHAVFIPVIDLLYYVAVAVLLIFGAVFVANGSMQLGMLIAFLMYNRRFYRPIMDLSQKYTILQDAMTASARIFDLLDRTDHTPEAAQDDVIHPDTPLRGHILFEDVTFEYKPNEPVLTGVSFQVQPGQRVAIVGITGAGKTTVMNLLTRLYDYHHGRIQLDGIDLKKLPNSLLHRTIVCVQQDVFLFAGTILDNIRLWNPEISEQEVKKAAEAVLLDPFVQRMPLGYHELVREGGANLSTGQKQLISFARALVHKPVILLLDEATSNIDTETESLVQEAMHNLITQQTSIIIAHRLSTIRNADRIFVLHHGQLVESGVHDELMRTQGIYARLNALQSTWNGK